MSIPLNTENKQRIIELYLCSNDRRVFVIAQCTNTTNDEVIETIQQFYEGKIPFERGNYKILHSSINGFD